MPQSTIIRISFNWQFDQGLTKPLLCGLVWLPELYPGNKKCWLLVGSLLRISQLKNVCFSGSLHFSCHTFWILLTWQYRISTFDVNSLNIPSFVLPQNHGEKTKPTTQVVKPPLHWPSSTWMNVLRSQEDYSNIFQNLPKPKLP